MDQAILEFVKSFALLNVGYPPNLSDLQQAWKGRELDVLAFTHGGHPHQSEIVHALAPNGCRVLTNDVMVTIASGDLIFTQAVEWLLQELAAVPEAHKLKLGIIGSPLVTVPVLRAACKSRQTPLIDTEVHVNFLIGRGSGVIIDSSNTIEQVCLPITPPPPLHVGPHYPLSEPA